VKAVARGGSAEHAGIAAGMVLRAVQGCNSRRMHSFFNLFFAFNSSAFTQLFNFRFNRRVLLALALYSAWSPLDSRVACVLSSPTTVLHSLSLAFAGVSFQRKPLSHFAHLLLGGPPGSYVRCLLRSDVVAPPAHAVHRSRCRCLIPETVEQKTISCSCKPALDELSAILVIFYSCPQLKQFAAAEEADGAYNTHAQTRIRQLAVISYHTTTRPHIAHQRNRMQ
jgi:hypothetical protein